MIITGFKSVPMFLNKIGGFLGSFVKLRKAAINLGSGDRASLT